MATASRGVKTIHLPLCVCVSIYFNFFFLLLFFTELQSFVLRDHESLAQNKRATFHESTSVIVVVSRRLDHTVNVKELTVSIVLDNLSLSLSLAQRGNSFLDNHDNNSKLGSIKSSTFRELFPFGRCCYTSLLKSKPQGFSINCLGFLFVF